MQQKNYIKSSKGDFLKAKAHFYDELYRGVGQQGVTINLTEARKRELLMKRKSQNNPIELKKD